ncbi:Ig-like domain-containing protein [Phenylobacterium sp. 58.2.17]|uniref:Ig-like domain-containing protein n=1 Tax=Phenylobacterium sp. 58.2.17 TaxID=2969306 RepID=UPI002263B80E|nr:Ig-like domain-containing protein [Phenylobacterium sp. 58.2.17]MCX7587470.1 Ig-like domain-containing protein [Phenylobacterium sp. 58.2.17]
MTNIANVAAVTASGSYKAGATVTLAVDFDDAVLVDTTGGVPTLSLSSGGAATYLSGSGSSTLTFTYTVGAGETSADLDYASTSALALNGAAITDAATHTAVVLTLATPGAAGSLGANANIVIDTAAPTVTGATVVFSADTGLSDTDLITNTPSQSVSGKLTGPLGTGETVLVSFDNGQSWTTATASGSTWNLPTPVTLAGSDTLKVRVDDAAGNQGSAASFAYVLDTTQPTTSISSLAFSADTGTSGSDFITNTAAQTISGTLSANLAAGEEVQVSTDNGASWAAATATVGSNTWLLSGVTLAQSSTLQARVVDTAGNEGTRLAQAYVYDTVAPTGVSSLSFSSDSGASSTDFVTNVSAQTISGVLSGGLAAGDRVLGSLDDGDTWVDITSKVSGTTLSWNGVTLAGSGVLKVQVVDVAGNASTAFTGYVLDTSAAAPSAPDLSAASDTGASSTDNITSDATPTFTGTSEANAAVSLFDTDGTTVLGTATADGSGNWSITSSTLAAGQHTISAAITDLAGNTSPAGAGLQITIEASTPPEPPPPSVVTVVTPSGSLITGDGVANLIEWSGSGADTIAGGAGNDTLIAGQNNDVLQGNTGADSISAGAGADIVSGGQGGDFLNGNQGNDLLFGDLGDDAVFGGKGDDFVHGNAGDDVLLGDLGDDTVLGGQGDDLLLGGDGADYLSGDKGDDVLIGGADADIFSFVNGAGRDVIADFSHAQGDHIRLSVAQAADFQALFGKMAMVGADTVISLDGLTIVLAGVPMSSLNSGDFLFS